MVIKKSKTLRDHIAELVAVKIEDRPELMDRVEEIVEEALFRLTRRPTTKRERLCPVTRDEFIRLAEPLVVDVGGKSVTARVKEFKSGALGWEFKDRTLQIEVGGQICVATIYGVVTIALSRNTPNK